MCQIVGDGMIVRGCMNQPGEDGQPFKLHPQPLFCFLLWDGQLDMPQEEAEERHRKKTKFITLRSPRRRSQHATWGHMRKHQSDQEAEGRNRVGVGSFLKVKSVGGSVVSDSLWSHEL